MPAPAPTETNAISVLVPEVVLVVEDTPKDEENAGETSTPSSPSTVITDSDEFEPGDTEVLEIGVSPLSDQSSDSSSHEQSSPEYDPIKGTVGKLLEKNKGSNSDLKRDLLTMKKFTKEFGDISNTQLKKLIYKEKMQQIKDLKRQHQQ
ncbi:unnamed protein product [Macrosiphum euphorbiae]|uniref:Uncharacterized protein n=1 Tax=Macrosiphum euphorbiae TaxID=13131 RepID=A0AAV0WLF4_9HEMI|nr:unnamed protein product [Macrosiphum euphorbiae]